MPTYSQTILQFTHLIRALVLCKYDELFSYVSLGYPVLFLLNPTLILYFTLKKKKKANPMFGSALLIWILF